MKNTVHRSGERSAAYSVAALLGIVAALYFLRGILVPLAFALTLTFLLTPAVIFLQKIRLGRVPAVMLILAVTLAAAGWSAWIIGNQLVDVVNQLPTYRSNIHAKLEAVSLSRKGPLGRAAASVKEIDQEISTVGLTPAPAPAIPATAATPRPSPSRDARAASAPPVAVQMVPAQSGFSYLRDLSASVVKPFAVTGIVIIFTIFMLLKREDLRNRILRLAGLAQINLMTQALDDAAQRVSRYLLMQFLVNAMFGVVVGIGLSLVGLPNPALWAVVAALLRIIPYAGAMIAGGLPLLLSLAVFNGWVQPLVVFLLFTVLEITTGNFIEPWLYGSHTGISSLALLVSAVFWTVLWGPAGLVLSTPLTVCVVVLGRYVPALSFLHILLGDEPVLSEEAQLYQRLLAMDLEEARSVVDQFLKTKSLVELYDTVFIPALNMAEQDRHSGAIDSVREEFLFLSINEMVAESCGHSPEADVPAITAVDAAPFRGRVICVPAHDQADAVAASMLVQILEQHGYEAIALPLRSSARKGITSFDVGPQDVICISALPPYAFAPARAMHKQLRARFPRVKFFVGVWGFAGDIEKAKARFEGRQPEQLVCSIREVVERMGSLAEPAGVALLRGG